VDLSAEFVAEGIDLQHTDWGDIVQMNAALKDTDREDAAQKGTALEDIGLVDVVPEDIGLADIGPVDTAQDVADPADTACRVGSASIEFAVYSTAALKPASAVPSSSAVPFEPSSAPSKAWAAHRYSG
jgi:hypothetical protein